MERYIKLTHKVINKLSQLSKEKHCDCLLNVYIALAYYADFKSGKCFPGYEKIGEIAGVSSRTSISKALKILEEESFIQKKTSHGRHGSNIYYLLKVHLVDFKRIVSRILCKNT